MAAVRQGQPRNSVGRCEGRSEVFLQNWSWKVNWKLRPSFNVLVILPNAGELKSGLGSANWGVLKKLIDSARKVRVISERSGQERARAAFMLRMPPRRKVLNPRLPRESFGWISAKAERGRRDCEVSGLPMERPRILGSRILGRSPLLPSTFPNPGPSDPEITVKGSPLLARNTPEIRHPPATRRRKGFLEEGIA